MSDLERALARIYKDLIDNMEDLDPEMMRIYHDNAWDLYIESEPSDCEPL